MELLEDSLSIGRGLSSWYQSSFRDSSPAFRAFFALFSIELFL